VLSGAYLRRPRELGVQPSTLVPFYPICIRTYIDDGQVSTRPIRIFHGGADDWLPVAACRQYVDRLRQAGKDIQLTEYAGAQHGFDNPTSPPTLRLPNVQAWLIGGRVRAEERNPVIRLLAWLYRGSYAGPSATVS
jgi:dienelactone hydrolase